MGGIIIAGIIIFMVITVSLFNKPKKRLLRRNWKKFVKYRVQYEHDDKVLEILNRTIKQSGIVLGVRYFEIELRNMTQRQRVKELDVKQIVGDAWHKDEFYKNASTLLQTYPIPGLEVQVPPDVSRYGD